MTDLPQTTQRIGDYVILRQIGQGGMGKVYEAEELLSRRRVALKILDHELGQSPAGRRQFVSEMAILASLDDPHVVRCLHCAEMDGQLVMVLELLDGRTLREVLVSHGRLAWPQVVAIARQISLALHAAHTRRPAIIHRDLKPENVMWLTDGRVKVMDFGIAKIVATVGPGPSSQSFGTLQYMSPEQIDARPLDGRSDLHALGLTMWELLVGCPPFQSDSPRVLLEKICNEPAPPLPDAVRRTVPDELAQLIARLLEKQPERRPSAAIELVGLLDALGGMPAAVQQQPQPQPTLARPPARAEYDTIAAVEHARAGRASPGRVAGIAAAGLVALGCLVGVGVWAWAEFGPVEAPPAATAPAGEPGHDLDADLVRVVGPFPNVAGFCKAELEDVDLGCEVRTGPGSARHDLPGFVRVEVVQTGDGLHRAIGLAFERERDMVVVPDLVFEGGGSGGGDVLRETTMRSDDAGVTIEFVLDHHQTVVVDDDLPELEQAVAFWTEITTLRCQLDADERPRCTKPITRQEARGAPTTAAREMWLAAVGYAIARMKVPGYAGKQLDIHLELTLEVCKDGSVKRVVTTRGSGDATLDERVHTELERLDLPKPPPEVAATFRSDCEALDYPFVYPPGAD